MLFLYALDSIMFVFVVVCSLFVVSILFFLVSDNKYNILIVLVWICMFSFSFSPIYKNDEKKMKHILMFQHKKVINM